ncbi:nuclear transport factor 2 family protein [Mycobacterium sp. PS03-16]|uniref:nuclear transport factor 2 family protein n=1 Tax=Mycobacterium sp. PS03-16 TaxID=2559611 RepID=UPI0010748AE7|nr:nuclear transport factor 2 family protein [Mycobacterium sp. PS03-16]TFV57866.1 nuclear transport factor 2 family protein [Mycobacterium sp. PS03-16]
MTTVPQADDDRIAALEERLYRLEAERDIQRLIASYGPCVDAANAAGAAELWSQDGSYDVEGWRMNSRDDVRQMVDSAGHRELVAGGCCHFLGPTVVTVDGDDAVALCESLVLVRASEADPRRVDRAAWRNAPSEYVVWRAAANHFRLRRVDGRWRIAARTSRLLNGNHEAHALLTAGIAGKSP